MRSVTAIAGAGMMLVGSLAVPAAPATGNPIAAVWREQQVMFIYGARTSRYSCEGLEEKLRVLLLELGARADVKVLADGCEVKMPSLKLVFSSPALPRAPARPAHPGDLAAVDARFEQFTLTSDAFRNFTAADCELVEDFVRQVLPRLAARAVRQDIACVRYPEGGSHYLVRGEILRVLPHGERRADTSAVTGQSKRQ
jgi:hypothetical protein